MNSPKRLHPLALFRYCPKCGSAEFVDNDSRSKRCLSCGFTYYHNASAATVAVIFNTDGALLVTRRAMNPAKGTLDLPGGFVDPGESITEGCLREVREETGLEAEIMRFLFSQPNTYSYSGFDVHTSDAFFLCRIKNDIPAVAADDAAEILWIPMRDIHPEAFGLESIRAGVQRLSEIFPEGKSGSTSAF